MPAQGLSEVKVEGRPKARGNEFVYVNSAFVGSVSSVNSVNASHNVNSVNASHNVNMPQVNVVPVTGVYREQYWACSRWPYTQRVLAIAVGILLGALIGLTISLLIRDEDENIIGPIFRHHSAAK